MDRNGLYPSGWTNFRLGDVAFESSTRLKDTDYNDLPVYGVDNVIGLNPNPRYTADSFDRYKVVEHGMFAYNPMRLNIGSIGYCSSYHEKCLVSPDYVVFGCLSESLAPDFLYHYTKSQRWADQTKNAGSGSVRFRIYYDNLASFPILLPPVEEQQKIAKLLNTWDEAIGLMQQLIAALRRRKQALMQLLLTGEVRFAEFDGSEWEEVRIDQIVSGKAGIKIGPFGSQLKKTELVKSGFKVYGQENVFESNFQIGNRYIDFDKFQTLSTCEIKPGDVLITMMGTVGKSAIVPENIEPGIMDSHLLRLRLDSDIYSKRLFVQLVQNSGNVKQQIRSLSVGGIMEGLSSKIIKAIELPLPHRGEQENIADVLNLEDEISKSYLQILEGLRTQKRGLMQQLLTGQVRVNP